MTTPQDKDLHEMAARLCLENLGQHDDREHGFVVVFIRVDNEPDEEVCAEIATMYGVTPASFRYLEEATDGFYYLRGKLPVQLQTCEILCRVIVEPLRGNEHGVTDEGCTYLEIVDDDGRPAIKVFD